MPGPDNVHEPDLKGITDRIAIDVLKAMHPKRDPEKDTEVREFFSNYIANSIRDGYTEKYNGALYKEDVDLEESYFVKGGNRLPQFVDRDAVIGAVNTFTQDTTYFLNQAEEEYAAAHPSALRNPFADWRDTYDTYVQEQYDKAFSERRTWNRYVARDILNGYERSPEIMTSANTYDVGLVKEVPAATGSPAQQVMETFSAGNPDRNASDIQLVNHEGADVIVMGDPKKAMVNDPMFSDAGKYSAKKFDAVFGGLFKDASGLDNPDVVEAYRDRDADKDKDAKRTESQNKDSAFIHLFTVDGRTATSKNDIMTSMMTGRNVEFTRFKMDDKGECSFDKIPITHAQRLNPRSTFENRLQPHVDGPADEKAKKAAQDITEKLAIEKEKKHLAYISNAKKLAADTRNNEIAGLKKGIKEAKTNGEKANLQTRLKYRQKYYKQLDKEMNPRLKAEEKACKARLKAAEKSRKDRIKADQKAEKARIKAEKKAESRRLKEEKARQKAEAKAAKKNGGKAPAQQTVQNKAPEVHAPANAAPTNASRVRLSQADSKTYEAVAAEVGSGKSGITAGDPGKSTEKKLTNEAKINH